MDALGKTYDVLGEVGASQHWNPGEFFNQILKHVKKVDVTVIDLTGFSQVQIDAVRAYIAGLPAGLAAKIKPIGFTL